MISNRMLTKAHLLRCPRQALLAAYSKYASVVPLRAPCIWAFLNILGKHGLSTNC